jgi:hypothetical protein
MDGRDEQVHRLREAGQTLEWMGGRMDTLDGWVGEWMEGRMGARMGGWTDG